MTVIQPDGWKRPSGYSNGIKADGEMLFVAGQVGWDEHGDIVGESMVDQTARALGNIVSVLEAGGARPEHVVRLTWYVTDLSEYKSASKEIGNAYRAVMGNHYPAMSLIQVAGLVENGAKVEIEATAVIPRKR